jgi:hypothetical protein
MRDSRGWQHPDASDIDTCAGQPSNDSGFEKLT